MTRNDDVAVEAAFISNALDAFSVIIVNGNDEHSVDSLFSNYRILWDSLSQQLPHIEVLQSDRIQHDQE